MKQTLLFLLWASLMIACNSATENNATTESTKTDSSLHMTDGTVNADTIDKRTDARLDRGLDTLK